MGLNILFMSACISLPVPLSGLFSLEACNWADLVGTLYLTGSLTWACLIALYRFAYLKSPRNRYYEFVWAVD
jgi:hypothetical protein